MENDIAASIVKSWDETLLVLYANVQTKDYQKQLQTAEQWLSIHSGSAVSIKDTRKKSVLIAVKWKKAETIFN